MLWQGSSEILVNHESPVKRHCFPSEYIVTWLHVCFKYAKLKPSSINLLMKSIIVVYCFIFTPDEMLNVNLN